MPRFSLADLVNIDRNPDPTLVDIINSAPAGQTPLLDNASRDRWTEALKARGEVAAANNPDKGRITSTDPSLDAIFKKQAQLTEIQNKIMEETVKAFDSASIASGAGAANATLRGLNLALTFNPEDRTLLQRKQEAEQQLDKATKNIPTLQEEFARKNTLELFQQKAQIENDLKNLERLRKEGQGIEGTPLGLEQQVSELTGLTIPQAREDLARGNTPDSIVNLGEVIRSNVPVAITHSAVLADTTSRQAFKNRTIRLANPVLREEIEKNFNEVYTIIDAERNRLLGVSKQRNRDGAQGAFANLLIQAQQTGQNIEDIVDSILRASTSQIAVNRLNQQLAKNPSWFMPDNLTEEEVFLANNFMTLLENESSNNGQENFINAFRKFSRDIRSSSATETSKDVLNTINRLVIKMTRAATQRYNATHAPLGLDLETQYLRSVIEPEIIGLLSPQKSTRGAADVLLELTRQRREAAQNAP